MAVEAAPFTHSPYAFCAPISTQQTRHMAHQQRRVSPRKSPRLQEDPVFSPVCLDYLKGICQLKRLNCKYAHPHIPLRPGERVCEVYVLTGECKFGERCRDYHPPMELLCAPVCAPVQPRADEDMTPAHLAEAFLGIQDILTDLVLTQYDYVRDSCCKAVAAAGSSNPAVAEYFAGVAYTASLADSSRAVFVAHLCEYVYNIGFSSDAARQAFKAELLKRCNKLFDAGEDLGALLSSTEEERQLLNEKRTGNAWFFGCLVRHNLIPITAWSNVSESLSVRAKRWDLEASVSVRLLCRLLQAAGTYLKDARPEELHRSIRNIRSAAPRHGKSAQAEVAATCRELLTVVQE